MILPKVPNRTYEQTSFALMLRKWYIHAMAEFKSEQQKENPNAEIIEEYRRAIRALCQCGRDLQSGTLRAAHINRVLEDNQCLSRMVNSDAEFTNVAAELAQFVPQEASRDPGVRRGSGHTGHQFFFGGAATMMPFGIATNSSKNEKLVKAGA